MYGRKGASLRNVGKASTKAGPEIHAENCAVMYNQVRADGNKASEETSGGRFHSASGTVDDPKLTRFGL